MESPATKSVGSAGLSGARVGAGFFARSGAGVGVSVAGWAWAVGKRERKRATRTERRDETKGVRGDMVVGEEA